MNRLISLDPDRAQSRDLRPERRNNRTAGCDVTPK